MNMVFRLISTQTDPKIMVMYLFQTNTSLIIKKIIRCIQILTTSMFSPTVMFFIIHHKIIMLVIIITPNSQRSQNTLHMAIITSLNMSRNHPWKNRRKRYPSSNRLLHMKALSQCSQSRNTILTHLMVIKKNLSTLKLQL